ncbi:Nuclease-related domain-containing protein [Lentibacillus persicus]|uniref:Nuclease-related domain-containing protein n=1 Tax=Lentibacillus persicus TaxID=640948 RepID=A0A1I1XYE9_9BACI|nr:nuclease-related domain-containing protein [Lentibacillus persicus]SFE10550.1 Nuclease-related domain-containing protein [Lentibacillus persicus]
MKIKPLFKPLPLQKHDATIPRLTPNFPKLAEMKEEARRLGRGYSGEIKVAYHIDVLASEHTILNDVYLHNNGKNFQIDFIVIATRAIFIIESKNYLGTIIFDSVLRQLIRDDGQVESGFEYPITQVENQQLHLQSWLRRHNLFNVPVFYLVAIAEPATIIKVEGDRGSIAEVVAHAARIPKMIIKKDKELAEEGFPRLQDYQIGKKLLHASGEFDMDIMTKYGITPRDLLPGVFCTNCGARGMERLHGGWQCHQCRFKSNRAHLKALADFVLLNGSISNRECIWFLGLPSPSTATRILKNSGLVYLQKNKHWVKET